MVSRRELLQRIVFVTGGALVASTGIQTLRWLTTSKLPLAAEAVPTPSAVKQYYPEVAHLPAKETVSLPHPQRTITIFNFSDLYIEPTAAVQLYTYYDSLNGLEGIFKTVPYKILSAQPALEYVFITPENAPPPAWDPKNEYESTLIINNDTVRITHIRAADIAKTYPEDKNLFDTNAKQTNVFLAIGACQSTIQIASTTITNAQRYTKAIQEFICNSLARGVAMRQHNIPYNTYVGYMKTHGMPIPVIGGADTFLYLPQKEYEEYMPNQPVLVSR